MKLVLVSVASAAVLTASLVGCKARTDDQRTAEQPAASQAEDASLITDAKVLHKSEIDDNYFRIECESGVVEIQPVANVLANNVCELKPVVQYFSNTKRESRYTTEKSGGPKYGARGTRFNVLPYELRTEDGVLVTQPIQECYDRATKDWYLSVAKCNGPGETKNFKKVDVYKPFGHVFKPSQQQDATMPLIACVREASGKIQKDTMYSHDGKTCDEGYVLRNASPMGYVVKKFGSKKKK